MKFVTIASRKAFTLVEVSMALGIAAFCLISLFGLLPVGLKSNQTAVEQTTTNGILSAIVADLRSTPVTSGSSDQFGIPMVSGSGTCYFTADAKKTSNPSEERYRLTFEVYSPVAGVKGATGVNAKLSWPAPASVANANGVVETFIALDRN